MLVQRRAVPLDYNGKRLVVLDNLLAQTDYERCCALQIVIPLSVKHKGRMAICFYCGKVFQKDMSSLGSHVYECTGESSPFRPLQSWVHRGGDVEENQAVVEALQKTITLQAFVEHNCSHRFMGLASMNHINMISQVCRLIGCKSDVDNPELFDLSDEIVNRKILERLKQLDGCFLYCMCLHNISAEPVAMLVLALDTEGMTSIVGSGHYKNKKTMWVDQEKLLVDTLKTLSSNGVRVMGFIQFGDQHCGRLVETMFEKHRDMLDGMLWLNSSERHDIWTRELAKAPSLHALTAPVLRVINVVKNNHGFKQILDACLQINKITDFFIWDEDELKSAVNYYEAWYQDGYSFFKHMPVFQVVQKAVKENKQLRDENPRDYDFFTSIEIRPDTAAFKAACETLLLLDAYTSIIKRWKSNPKQRTEQQAKRLISQELGKYKYPDDLKDVFTDVVVKDLFNAFGGIIPRDDNWESFNTFLNYTAVEENQSYPPLLSQDAAEEFLQSLYHLKNDKKEVVAQFHAFLEDCPLLKVGRFENSPYQYWKENGEKYPLLAPIAIACLSLPKSNDDTISLNMMDNVLSNMFLHLTEKQVEPLRRLQFWFNQFRVTYLSEVEHLLLFLICLILYEYFDSINY